MSKFELLSVAEDNWQSDRLTARMDTHYPNRQVVKISFTGKRNMIIESSCPNSNTPVTVITAFDIDIQSLLDFVQEAKTFISEEEMVAKLTGK